MSFFFLILRDFLLAENSMQVYEIGDLDGNKTEHCLVGVKFICQYDVIQIKLLGIWKKNTKTRLNIRTEYRMSSAHGLRSPWRY